MRSQRKKNADNRSEITTKRYKKNHIKSAIIWDYFRKRNKRLENWLREETEKSSTYKERM